jgi:hypothetical protein
LCTINLKYVELDVAPELIFEPFPVAVEVFQDGERRSPSLKCDRFRVRPAFLTSLMALSIGLVFWSYRFQSKS